MLWLALLMDLSGVETQARLALRQRPYFQGSLLFWLGLGSIPLHLVLLSIILPNGQVDHAVEPVARTVEAQVSQHQTEALLVGDRDPEELSEVWGVGGEDAVFPPALNQDQIGDHPLLGDLTSSRLTPGERARVPGSSPSGREHSSLGG